MATPPLTVGTVARRLSISEDRVRQLSDIGALPSTRTSMVIRLFDVADIERFPAERDQRYCGPARAA
jgi:DNA-binding transcriptional MerR regulator